VAPSASIVLAAPATLTPPRCSPGCSPTVGTSSSSLPAFDAARADAARPRQRQRPGRSPSCSSTAAISTSVRYRPGFPASHARGRGVGDGEGDRAVGSGLVVGHVGLKSVGAADRSRLAPAKREPRRCSRNAGAHGSAPGGCRGRTVPGRHVGGGHPYGPARAGCAVPRTRRRRRGPTAEGRRRRLRGGHGTLDRREESEGRRLPRARLCHARTLWATALEQRLVVTTGRIGEGDEPPRRRPTPFAFGGRRLAANALVRGLMLCPRGETRIVEWMEQVGARVASPLTLLREYAVAVCSMLPGLPRLEVPVEVPTNCCGGRSARRSPDGRWARAGVR
jgi:hypothetical protein